MRALFMYILYILKSLKNGRYYIGQTSNIQSRIHRHNSKKVPSTAGLTPWVLVYLEFYETRSEVVKRERQIKGWKSRKAIERLLDKGV